LPLGLIVPKNADRAERVLLAPELGVGFNQNQHWQCETDTEELHCRGHFQVSKGNFYQLNCII